MTEYKMLKIPSETWNRLKEFVESHQDKYPRITSLHNAISVLLDIQQSGIDQGGEIELNNESRSKSGYYYPIYTVKGKLDFPVGIVKPKRKGKDKKKSDK